jgi:hypothetical protein
MTRPQFGYVGLQFGYVGLPRKPQYLDITEL